MSIGIRFLACTLVGAFLALVSVAGLADTRGWQFTVMVRVLPHCQYSLASQYADRGRFVINCTRNTGYSVSLTRAQDSIPERHPAVISGVGSGTRRVIALNAPAGASAAASQNAAPLFLTINF